jgi:hypothetical protein
LVEPRDEAVIAAQLGRPPRSIHDIGHRCPCGNPDVVRTAPRLPDGTPFPTSFYATCPRLTGALSTLESQGVMREMSERLEADADLAASYRAAHEDYLRRRAELGEVPEVAGVSAGGMPTRVKCLHVLAAHSLGAGPGVNPLGDETLDLLDPWWVNHPCALDAPGAPATVSQASDAAVPAASDVRDVRDAVRDSGSEDGA